MNKHLYKITNEDMYRTIWRYMDFSKFIDMLENKSIFFPKVDVFEDKLEGIHNALRESDYYSISDKGDIYKLSEEEEINTTVMSNSENLKAFVIDKMERVKNSSGISCWRISEEESHAMWKVFLSSNDGIVIKTTLGKLYNSISNINSNTVLHYGKVVYIDYASESIPVTNMMNALFHKNIYFEHEKELRVVAYQINDPLQNSFDDGNLIPIEGTGILMDLDYTGLIDEIRISPYAPSWFFSLVKKMVVKYNLDIPVVPSILQLRS